MKNIKSLGSIALLLGFAVNSQATLLTSGSTVSVSAAGPTDGLSASSTLVGSLVNQTLNPTSPNGPYPLGSLSSWVYTGNSANPFGSTDLTFVYQLAITSDLAETLALNLFPDASVTVDYSLTSPAGTAPGTASVPTTANLSGADTLNFFLPQEKPGSSPSAYLIVNTADTGYGANYGNIIDNGTSSALELAPVPEPSTIMSGTLLLLPFGASTLRILRKNRTA